MSALPHLPLGTADFERLRSDGDVYVDKTGLMATFLTSRSPVFISRPRRFGKSLLCSTLRSFFTHGIEYFKGLELEHWWQEQPESIEQDLTGNTVLHLDFSVLELHEMEGFARSFQKELTRTIKGVCPDFESRPDWDAKALMSAFLSSRESASVVLLIDEYDAPFTYFMDRPDCLWQIRAILDDFYRMLKDHEEKLKFFFLTGVTRITNAGVFAGFNNVDDLTLNGTYATLVGYTEEELHRCFEPYIQHAAQILNRTVDEVYSGLKDNYCGYRFSPQSNAALYSPWSVLGFLEFPGSGFVNYWYDSGGLSTDHKLYFARRCSLNVNEMAVLTKCSGSALDGGMVLNIDDKAQTIDDKAQTITPDYDPTLMLCQAGYLTIKESTYNPNFEDHTLLLGPSNNEVLKSLRRSLRDMVRKGLSTELRGEVKNIKETLLSGDLKKLSHIFECYLNSWTYDNKTLTSENACRGLITTWLQAAGFDAIAEAHSAGGRCDILLTIPEAKLRYAFEFKVQHQGENPDKRLGDALKQLVENDYGQVPPVSYELKKVGVVIGPDFRSIVKIALVQD